MIQLRGRIRYKRFRKYMISMIWVFTVVGRMGSGVHWFTDIVGGGLLSAGLVMLYVSIQTWQMKMLGRKSDEHTDLRDEEEL